METLLVIPESNEQMKTVKAVLKALNVSFTSKKENDYNPEFVKKIKESRQQVREGKVVTVNTKDLWK